MDARRPGGDPIPRSGAPRRFACALASVWLVVTALVFAAGYAEVGQVLGLTMAVIAAVPATTDFCIPSFVFGLLFGQPAGATCRLWDTLRPDLGRPAVTPVIHE